MKSRIAVLTFLCVLSLAFKGGSQDTSRLESLNAFFGGIPITEGLDSCKVYIASNPLLGIDSITEKGICSSFKQGKKDHFPFPDSVEVKIVLITYRGDIRQSPYELPIGTKGIVIAGLFGTDKNSKQTSLQAYNKLKKILKNYYAKKEDVDYDNLFFSEGKNSNFQIATL